jgi:hypothetical protein
MPDVDARLAEVLSILEPLEHDYKSATDALERDRIKKRVETLMSEIPDEHLRLLGLYDEARVREAETHLEHLRNILSQLEAEKGKRESDSSVGAC